MGAAVMRNLQTMLIGVGLVLLLALSGVAMVFWTDRTRLAAQLKESDELFKKFQQESARLETEKAQLAREHEALQTDVMAYLATNTKLQEETEDLNARLTEADARVEEQTLEIEKLQDKLEKLHKQMSRNTTERRVAATQQLKAASEKAAALERTLKTERSLYQYNLGVVYAQGKRYDEAIEAYRKSIELNPKNAEAHYNLGLLFDRVKSLPDRAAWHYRRYLELKPQAEDRDEVQQWIDMLTASVR